AIPLQPQRPGHTTPAHHHARTREARPQARTPVVNREPPSHRAHEETAVIPAQPPRNHTTRSHPPPPKPPPPPPPRPAPRHTHPRQPHHNKRAQRPNPQTETQRATHSPPTPLTAHHP